MAYEEYYDLIYRAKDIDTKYVVYGLDGEHLSRNADPKSFVYKSLLLASEMVNEFLSLEKELGKTILAREGLIISKNLEDLLSIKVINPMKNPAYMMGDLLCFAFNRENINDELFISIFYKCASNIDNHFTYHMSKQNYEKNDYSKGKDKLWVGYAEAYINYHKEERICYLNIDDVSEM